MGDAISIISFLCLLSSVSAQTENTEGLESCNVVCNCNSDPATKAIPHQELLQGAPGKLGPKGDVGPVGRKGDKGDTGLKGQKGKDADEVLISKILGAMSVKSCDELASDYHISRSGYHLMRGEGEKPVYKYCDFRIYSGVSTCDSLLQTYNLSIAGYYKFGNNASFQFCNEIYTCQDLRNRSPQHIRSGFYGLKVSKTVRVYCDFSQTPAVTEVHHDRMLERSIQSSCEEDGCFTSAPRYSVTGDDLMDIIGNSQSCRQFLKLRCKGVSLRNGDTSWWVSRTGEKMRYWAGARQNEYCACGETNSCRDTSYKCNCDQNSRSVTTADEGYITDKTKLPIREIRVGDHGDSGEAAWYTIGKLECFGQV